MTDSSFVFFRLSLVLPWPRAAAPPGAAAAEALGDIFDSTCVPHFALRKTANVWIRRGAALCRPVIQAWADGAQRAWLAAGGKGEAGAGLLQDPLPSTMPQRLAALCGRG